MHALTVKTQKGASTGICSCGETFGPARSGDGSIPIPGSTDRRHLSWTGRSVIEAAHACHVAWGETPTALAAAA